ncbi:ATP-dependent protease [Spirochaetia bacterium]|nr:ATP-dependent protease [Spirochaetia bacterium]GHU29547.1 ATP-dependent protease [Spirochaetia bacterium]
MFVAAYTPFGAEGIVIRVEADIRRGIPGIDVTGLAEGAVREARERVRAAFRNSGYLFPPDRILINLAPAGVRKDGASLDLPIAISVMAAAGLVPNIDNVMVLGELELSGKLRPVRGVLAATAAGIRAGIQDFVVPAENAAEAAILATGHFTAARTLSEAVEALHVRAETGSLPPCEIAPAETNESAILADFSEVRDQGKYKRALEIAAAGAHNLLVFGPPGAGKTMLARRLPGIMAPLLPWEAVEVTSLHSLSGQLGHISLITEAPFRTPHHSASAEGILGGGKNVRPGEISLAHFGTLFLDEAPEFRSNVLQSLREPLEDGVITISRAEGPVKLPADFQIVLAANTCPCGRLGMRHGDGEPVFNCFCSPEEIHRYWRKFGAALLDRVELRVGVNTPDIAAIGQTGEETSAAVAARVLKAVERQRERFTGTKIRRNARMPPALLDRFCILNREAESVLHTNSARLGLSGRAFHGIVRVARTIADLEGTENILPAHIEEAIVLRRQGDDPYDILNE